MFQEGTWKALKIRRPILKNFLIFFEKKFFPHFEMTADRFVKQKKSLYSKMTADSAE